MPKSPVCALGVACVVVIAWSLASCGNNSSSITRFEMVSSNLGFSPQTGSNQIISGVAVNGPIVFRFNLPVAPATVTPNTIQIFEPDNNNAPAMGQLLVGPAPGIVAGAGDVAFIPDVTYDSGAQTPQLGFGLQFSTKYRIVIPNDQATVLRSLDGQPLSAPITFEFTTGSGGSNPACPEAGDAIVDPTPGLSPAIEAVEVFQLDQAALGQGVFPVEVSSCGSSLPATPDPIWIRITLNEPVNTDQCLPNLLAPPSSTFVDCTAGGTAALPAAVLVQSDPFLGDSVVTNVQLRLVTGFGSTMFPGENPLVPKSYLLIIPTAPLPFLDTVGEFRVEISLGLEDLTPVLGGEVVPSCLGATSPCCFFSGCNCIFTLQSVASCI